MSFNPSAGINEIQDVGAGVVGDSRQYGYTKNFLTFEDGLVAGRFAKLDTGSIDNIDGSDTPTVLGVALKEVITPVEDANLITIANNLEGVRVRIKGEVTVEAVSGLSPSFWDDIFVDNTNIADYGKAKLVGAGSDVATTAKFIESIGTDTWKIIIL